ncbi:MAG: hypothetical protein DRI94_10435 [Bacteroidetes bacterium]|nr:MAG: hypothetical protein DRI94_10435 [Bacteroidota bacterium]
MDNIKYYVMLSSIYIPVFWVIILLFSNFRKEIGKIFLLFLFINIAFEYYMTYNRYYEHFAIYSKLFPLQVIAVLNSFPLYYLYLRSVVNERNLVVKDIYKHFLLSIFFGIIFIILMYFLMDKNERSLFVDKQLYFNNINNLKFKIGYYLYRYGKIIYILQSVFYLLLIIKLYKNNIKNSKERFSNSEGVDLIWLRNIGIAFIFVFIFNFIMHILKLKYITTHNLLIIISYIIFSLFFMAVGVLSYKQKQIYASKLTIFESKNIKDKEKLNINYINEYLLSEKAYLNPDFNIFDLCKVFKTNRSYISNIIKQESNNNFRTFINKYRVKDAKDIIKEAKEKNINISLEEISKNAGFNSYTTFLRVFKSLEGMSPTLYKDKI